MPGCMRAIPCSSIRGAIAVSAATEALLALLEPFEREEARIERHAARVDGDAGRHRAGDGRPVLLQILGEDVAHRALREHEVLAAGVDRVRRGEQELEAPQKHPLAVELAARRALEGLLVDA